ncbi:MAG TPA: hypothetical protein VJR91_20865 [Burkholderia sp.]|nr:hypothetical protein [Burkholderia sp.]
MHSVLTILPHRPVDGRVDNHARYAREHGCRHAIVDGTHVYGERQQVLHKYHAIIAQLVAMDDRRAAQQRTREPARHLNPHADIAFVFWVDADILAIDPRQTVDNVIDGRDWVIGTDHGLGDQLVHDRRAQRRADARPVERICARIERFDDRSSVYASGSDQQAIYVELRDAGVLDARYIVDAIALASSPLYATRDSRFVHFAAQHNHYRAVTMRVRDRLSHQRWSTECAAAFGVPDRGGRQLMK